MCIFVVFALTVVIVRCDRQLSDSYRSFSTELFNVTAFVDDKRSVALSPYSIWSVMFSVALGVNDTSAKQVYEALRLPHENYHTLIKDYRHLNDQVIGTDEYNTNNVSVISSNYMFLENSFEIKPSFNAFITLRIGIETKTLSFNNTGIAVNMAKEFIARSGFKGESKLYDFFFDKSRMVLSSQTSFEGSWKLPFSSLDTTVEPFHSENGDVIREIFMMRQRNRFAFTHIKEIDAFILELPYGLDSKYCMLIMLPSPRKRISEVYKGLVNFTLLNILDKLDNDTHNHGLENIEVRIPRFEIKTNSRLDNPLNRMGVYDIFDQKLADFRRVTEESIFVSMMEHYAHIGVTESGTVASAATSIVFVDTLKKFFSASGAERAMPAKKSPIYSAGFIANRPFIYFIMEKTTKSILYGGVYSELTVF